METLIIIWTICIAFLFFAYAGIILFMGFHRRNIKFRELLGIYIFAIPLAPLALFFLPLIRKPFGKDFKGTKKVLKKA